MNYDMLLFAAFILFSMMEDGKRSRKSNKYY